MTTATHAVQKAPRKGCVDVFNEFMLDGVELAGYYKIPTIKPETKLPERMVPFSEAVNGREKPSPGTWVHFYEDDGKFERFWRNPRKYVEKLRGFEGFVSPDYSLYADFTPAQKIWNTHRNYAVGAWLQQSQGFHVLPNVRTDGWDSVPYSLAGAPRRSPIVVGSHGCLKNREDRALRARSAHVGGRAQPQRDSGLRHRRLRGLRLPKAAGYTRQGLLERDATETRRCA